MHYNALFGIGAAHFVKGDYGEAVKWVEEASQKSRVRCGPIAFSPQHTPMLAT